ncbi:DUF2491 family protein [Azospirillum soli]|uniref:DUF2491 family protein n=1 Tax=Azospirillum soli TaxID=1304799 RepID=UPI001FE56309|nr:DUF2491 family protein [Azospirillum soli]MBP2314662.1 hypothetical protein [Azospirillum soli]
MPPRKRLIVPLLSVLLALAPMPPVSVSVVAVGVAAVVWPDVAEARAGGGRSSSGGYSRPSRTPSVTVRPSAPRTPSMGSGGYSRPQTAPSPGTYGRAPYGGGDASVSRRQSGEALERYRIEQQRQRTPPVTTPAPAPRNDYGWGGGGSWGGGWGSGWGQRRSGGSYGPGGWYGGWRPPGWAYGGSPSFGLWNGLFLWFLLDNLTRPGYADWFHHHQGDPGYAQWRAEAERRAQDDPQLRARLDDLDNQLRAQEGQPRDPNYLPPDTPREVARADTSAPASRESGGGGFGTVVILLVAGAGVVAFMVLRRRANTGGSSMSRTSLGTAANIIRQKVSGKPYEPSLFRVGMTLTLDPTPFLLAGTATKVTPPGGSGGDALVSVEAVGTLKGGGVTLHRLYLQGGRGFFQLHLGADGVPDECRWFSTLDEVQPADSEEWAFWLADADGMVGYPQFQTKDGKLYDRQWNPSAARIAPVVFDETVTDHRGSRTRRLSAMLYAAGTGATDPAPTTEYVLVAAVEDSGSAWVEVRAGIDINPATLSLT